MTIPTRVATVAVIGVVVVGAAAMLANRSAPTGPGGEQTITPAPSIAAGPSPGFVGSGPLEPGPYRGAFIGGGSATFTIPAGWAGNRDTGFAVLKEGDGENDLVILSFWQPVNVYADPCNAGSLPDPGVGPTVDDLVSALAAQPFTEATPPTPVTVDGFTGQRIGYNVDLGAASCPGMLRLWRDADGGDWTYFYDQLNELTILDVAGTRVVIKLSYYPDTPEADLLELRAIFDTIRIDP